MSNVPKGEHGKSPVGFLKVCRELKIITIEKCTHIPKRYWRTLADPMILLSVKAKENILIANSIYPTKKTEAETRKEHFRMAKAMLFSLISDIDDLHEPRLKDKIGISYEAMDEWTKMVTKLITLLDGVMESDSRRFRNLL